jgi:transposase InsO family protein
VLQIAASGYRRHAACVRDPSRRSLRAQRDEQRAPPIERVWRGNLSAYGADKVNRPFKAERPNQLWVSDFTYVSPWQGWWYVAFVIDVFARRILGWQVSNSMRTDFVLNALEQALYARQPERDSRLIHPSDRGSQYVSIRYSHAWPRRALNRQWVVAATGTTMPWLSPSMVQSPTLARTHRLYSTRPGRSQLLPPTGLRLGTGSIST